MKTPKQNKDMWKKLRVFTLLCVMVTLVYGQKTLGQTPGSLDERFGVGGKVVAPIGAGSTTNRYYNDGCRSSALVRQSDGKLVVAGADSSHFALMRYHSDGLLDSAFGTNGKVVAKVGSNSYAAGLIQQSDGKLVAVGAANDQNVFAVVRINSDGTVDSTFGTNGSITINVTLDLLIEHEALAVIQRADGKLIVAGYAVGLEIVCFNQDGTLDESFGVGGKVSSKDGMPHAMVLQSDGKIVVVGYSNWTYGFFVNRYTASGVIDNTFGTNGTTQVSFYGLIDGGSSSSSPAYAVTQQSDGKLVIVGSDNNERYGGGDSQSDFVLARLNTDGSLDSSFNGDGRILIDNNCYIEELKDVVQQPDGKLVVGGYASNGLNEFWELLRYNTDGTLDSSFGSNGAAIIDLGSKDEKLSSLVLLPNGNFIAGGYAASESSENLVMVRINGEYITPSAPSLSDVASSDVDEASATLSGTVNPNGYYTTYQFEWGTTSGNYTSFSTETTAGSGTGNIQVQAALSGLSNNTTFYYRLSASNENGTTTSTEKSFRTTAGSVLISVPDTAFRAALENHVYPNYSMRDNGDGTMTVPDASMVSRLVINDYGIQSLTGIEAFSELEKLYCYNNELSYLNLSQSPKLQTIYCYNNKLDSLNVAGADALEHLYCYNNYLTKLDVSGMSHLKSLYCYNNEIDSLNLTGADSLTHVYCSSNRLDTLDASGASTLQTLDCRQNVNGTGTDMQVLYLSKGQSIENLLIDPTTRILEKGILDIEESPKERYEYALEQNYPNPFNPSTTIAFSMKQAGNAKLSVYDLLGRVVYETVLDVSAGSHTIQFHAGHLTSGIYFYRLVASGNVIGTKKMLLLK
ncbi:leucine-rich repeat domain-containing protein [Chloroherpeton thalassium]|nr:leucine-rich repeat domain-containing protein [Chloroherpeton thalassium]